MKGVALIGYGYWGKNLSRVISSTPNCRLQAIIDLNKNSLTYAQDAFPEVLCSADISSILYSSQVNVVVVSTPVSTHYEIVKQCLLNGKHVLCEKVLSTDVEQIKELFELAKSQDLLLEVGFTFLHNAIIDYINKAINDNTLGALSYLTFKRTGLGPVRDDVDAINDLAAHDVSILISWFGRPDWVMANAVDLMKNAKADIAFIQVGYLNGLIAHIQVSWATPLKQRVIEIVGSNGMMIFDDVTASDKLKHIKTGMDYQANVKDFASFQLSVKSGDVVIPHINYPEPLRVEFDSFIDKIDKNTNSDDLLYISTATAEVLQAIQNSLHNQKKNYL